MEQTPAKPPPKLIRVFGEDGREMWVPDPYEADEVPLDPLTTEPAVNFEAGFQVLAVLAFVWFLAWLLFGRG